MPKLGAQKRSIRDLLVALPLDRVPQYHEYFQFIKPTTDEEVFRRGLFALASVHTTWESNLELYGQLWDYSSWFGSLVALRERIVRSRAGLVNNRTKFVHQFAVDFWLCPAEFRKQTDEDWEKFRGRIQKRVLGLGVAKSAFFVELVYLEQAEVVCPDTHFFQDFGYTPAKIGKSHISDAKALQMCNTWLEATKEVGIPPVTARWMRWDVKQEKHSPRYWTHVLEGRPPTREEPQMFLPMAA